MKTIKVIAIEKRATETYVDNLKIFFDDYANVDGICLREDSMNDLVEADVFVVSNPAIFNYINDLIPNDSNVVYIDIAFYQKDIEKLTTIPKRSNVLLVDYKEYAAISLVALINEYGINHINIVPYAPEISIKNLDEFSIAITPGLFELVPEEIEEIINIGYRKIDISTITSIASILNISSFDFNRKVIEYSEELCNRSKVLSSILKNLNKDQIYIEAILDSIDDGIIIHDQDHNILHCSKYLCKLFKKETQVTSNCPQDVYECCQGLLKMDEVENYFMKLNDDKINTVVTKRVLNTPNKDKNFIIILKDAESIHNIEIGIRKSMVKKGYVAKYNFDDIVYHSKRMKDTMERAKKISTLDVTTLIYGDTGTGKELLAHSIHNNSSRKNYPFLAINCAAISENLLESELFGYEEGSFTGAKKGGKKGLFELAHNGTLFLDELSSISQRMQVKLLRVLQEREIMRIGGTTLIPINVRVIAVTNENLERLIDEGSFRKDLYYRINNFTINIPPLKDRREDIPFIIESIMQSHNSKKQIDANLMNFLMNYKWPGNIRELKNCIEYLIYMGGKKLTIDDLPPTIRLEEFNSFKAKVSGDSILFDEEKIMVNKILEICLVRSIGRERLHTLLIEQGHDISEHKLRKLLNYLKEQKLISYGKGRSGIKVL
jgi:transcriptional regulator with PAS, ATPase and Fis domain